MTETTYDLFQQGRAHLKSGMAAQATVSLEKAKRREPDKASIREALGIAYFRIRRYGEAEPEFRAMLDLSPADDYAHYALGRCLEKQGKAAEANGHYKLARSLRPGTADYEVGQRLGRVRAVVQRVSRASATPGGAIGAGLLVLLGVADGDTAQDAERGWPERSRACASSRTRRANSTARSSTPAARRSSSPSSR